MLELFFYDIKFSMTTHCGALFLKKEYQKSILFELSLYIIKSIYYLCIEKVTTRCKGNILFNNI